MMTLMLDWLLSRFMLLFRIFFRLLRPDAVVVTDVTDPPSTASSTLMGLPAEGMELLLCFFLLLLVRDTVAVEDVSAMSSLVVTGGSPTQACSCPVFTTMLTLSGSVGLVTRVTF